jgi:hypothetical protein
MACLSIFLGKCLTQVLNVIVDNYRISFPHNNISTTSFIIRHLDEQGKHQILSLSRLQKSFTFMELTRNFQKIDIYEQEFCILIKKYS